MSEETKEEITELSEEGTSLEELPHHEEELKKLELKEILYLVLIGFVSTLLFFILLFPTEEVLRSSLFDRTRKSGIILDFKNLNFPIFGKKSLDSFLFQNTSGLSFKSEEVEFQVSLSNLLLNHLDLEMDMLSSVLETRYANWNSKSTNINISLENIDKPMKWNGDFVFLANGGKITDLHDVPMLSDMKDIKITKLSLFLKLKYGKATIDKGILDLSILKGSLSGTIKMNELLMNSNLDLKFCFNFTESFSMDRPDIAGYTAILPKEGNRTCIPILGTLGSPRLGVQLQQSEQLPSE